MKIGTLGSDYTRLINLSNKYGIELSKLPDDFDTVLFYYGEASRQLREIVRVRKAFEIVHSYAPETYPNVVEAYSRLDREEFKLRADLSKEVEVP